MFSIMNMESKYVSASTSIQYLFSKVVYVHCMNHHLKLCVAKTCSIQMVQNMMTNVRKLSEFFSNSSKNNAAALLNYITTQFIVTLVVKYILN